MRRIRKKFIDQAIILCGGYGSRLGKITKKIPKPLIKIYRKPFIEFLLDHLEKNNFKEVILLCHYQYLQFEEFVKKLKKKRKYNFNIKIVVEKEKLGTGGAVKNCLKYLDEYFLLMNGDTYCEIDLIKILNEYDFKNNTYTVLTNSKQDIDGSKVEIRKNNIKKFNSSDGKYLNTGISIISKKNLSFLNNRKFHLEKDYFENLLKKKKLKYFITKNRFYDIGTKTKIKIFKNIIKKKKLQPAAFFDRDGVINYDRGYTYKKKDFKFKKNIVKTFKYLKKKNYLIFVVSNQSGIGRGYYNESDVDKLHNWINKKLHIENCNINEFVYAPYYKKSNQKKYRSLQQFKLRKPNNGMILYLKKKWNIDTKKSFLIGDKLTDIQAGVKSKIYSKIVQEQDDLFFIVSRVLKRLHAK